MSGSREEADVRASDLGEEVGGGVDGGGWQQGRAEVLDLVEAGGGRAEAPYAGEEVGRRRERWRATTSEKGRGGERWHHRHGSGREVGRRRRQGEKDGGGAGRAEHQI